MNETCPLRTSVSAAALPLYGMCWALMPALSMKTSAVRCPMEPLPDEANVYFSGLLRSRSINSCALLAWKLDEVTST